MLNSPLSSYQTFGNGWSLPHKQSVLFLEVSPWLAHIAPQETGFQYLHCSGYLFFLASLYPDFPDLSAQRLGQRFLHGTDPVVCNFKDS